MRRLASTLALALALAAAGCGSDAPTGPHAEVSGLYTLQRVNGSALPVLFGTTEGVNVYLVSGAFTFGATDGCSETSVYRYGDVEDETTEDAVTNACGYSVNGNRIIVSYIFGGDLVGTVSGSTITFDAGNLKLVYAK